MDYAKGLAAARKRCSCSKRQLAIAIGVDKSYITHIEKGRRVPTLGVLERCAEALEMPFFVLLWLCTEERDVQGISGKEEQMICRSITRSLSYKVANAAESRQKAIVEMLYAYRHLKSVEQGAAVLLYGDSMAAVFDVRLAAELIARIERAQLYPAEEPS